MTDGHLSSGRGGLPAEADIQGTFTPEGRSASISAFKGMTARRHHARGRRKDETAALVLDQSGGA
jgi:hypothetical protein